MVVRFFVRFDQNKLSTVSGLGSYFVLIGRNNNAAYALAGKRSQEIQRSPRAIAGEYDCLRAMYILLYGILHCGPNCRFLDQELLFQVLRVLHA
jgi:hypothetical protein